MFSKLPSELILLIIKELVAEDLYTLANTCRHLENICLPIYIRVSGMQVCKGVLSLERPDFGPLLGALSRTPYLDGMDIEDVLCDLPSPLTWGKTSQLDMLGRVLDRPRSIKHLAFKFYLGHTDHITSIARDWMIALADLLCIVAVNAEDIEFRVSAAFSHKPKHDAAATQIQWKPSKAIPANPLVKTLYITGPACVVEVLASKLHNVGSITSLRIQGRNESTFQLRDILLPNLTEASLRGLIVHGASLKAFLARHPRLHGLTIDIHSKELHSPPHVRPRPEMVTTEIELPIMSALMHLAITVPSALLFLQQPHFLPNLSLLALLPETMDWTPQYFWDLFATEGAFPNLEKIIIESASLVGWIFDCGVALGGHGSMAIPIPIRSIKFLAFEGGLMDREGNSSLHPQCLDHLSKWLPRFFPNLQTLTMHNIFICKDTRDQEDSVSCLYSMVGISPIIEIYHDSKYASFMGGTVSYEH